MYSSFYRECRHRSGQGNGGLDKGVQFIWMCVVSNFFDLDSFTMTDVSAPPSPVPTLAPTAAPVTTTEPLGNGAAYGGIPVVVPGILQAEEFDLGGEGVAYHDTTPGNKKGVRRRGGLSTCEHWLPDVPANTYVAVLVCVK